MSEPEKSRCNECGTPFDSPKCVGANDCIACGAKAASTGHDTEDTPVLPPPPIVGIFTCPKCGHQAVPPPGPPPEHSVFRCEPCGTRVAFGEAMPRVVVTPHESDARFVLVRVGNVEHKFDRRYAHAIGLNMISITGP